MSRNKVRKQFTKFDKSLTVRSPFLTVFFYLSQNKSQHAEALIKFFQNNHMKVRHTKNTKLADSLQNFVKNANFVAQTSQSVSKTEFEAWSPFLLSHVIVVAFFYQNQIWDMGRRSEKNKIFSCFVTKPVLILRNTLKRMKF